ncbi:MAG: tyrosine-type recombinase/integrase [Oscillospiraceae bacterium]|nr:MAG: tyrosine-type recombinase/integrase [Oscillospiraceae bacterium]
MYLNGIMSYAIEKEIISHNPVSNVNFKQFTYKPVEVQSDVVNQMKGNTSHGFRKQFLTDEALKILHKAKELNPNGIYVFEPNGEIMTTDSFNRRLKKYCKEAGVPYHSSHKIRFYNASTAFDGNNLTTLSYLMGHSETATTLHYLRNVNKRKNDRLAFQNLGISS